MLRIGARRLGLPAEALPTPIVTIGLVMSLALLGDSLLYVALPAHAVELGLPLWAVGVLLGANRIVRLVTNGLAAVLFTRIGARGPVVTAGVFSVMTTAMYGLTPTFWPFLLARLVWGTCFSILRLGAFTVVLSASRPGTRGRLVGLYQSISRIGPVASLLVGGLLVETLGYHTAFAILGLASAPAIVLALSLPSSAYRPKTLTPQPPVPHEPLTPQPPLPAAGEGEQEGYVSPLPRTGTSGRGPANIVRRTTSQPMFAPRSGGAGGKGHVRYWSRTSIVPVSAVTSPTTAAASAPPSRSRLTSSSVRSGATAISRPPEVWASARIR